MKPKTPDEMEAYLTGGGWLLNRNGWWHPPNCVASWPIEEAFAMAQKDEAKGLRMTPSEVREYLRD